MTTVMVSNGSDQPFRIGGKFPDNFSGALFAIQVVERVPPHLKTNIDIRKLSCFFQREMHL